MRILICGSRNYEDTPKIYRYLYSLVIEDRNRITIVHGAAKGADFAAGFLGKAMGFSIDPHEADWPQHGKSAGILRNIEMLESGVDLVVYFSKDLENSKGTSHMVKIAREANVPVQDGELI